MIQWIYHTLRARTLTLSDLQQEVSTRNERDPSLAPYLRRSFKLGHTASATALAKHYYHRLFFTSAAKLLKVGIDLNQKEAQLAYAVFTSIPPSQYPRAYWKGHLDAFPPDTSYPINDWIERGALDGDPDAMFRLGHNLLLGEKIACDHAQGVYWLLCAAALQHPKAAYHLFVTLATDAVSERFYISKSTSKQHDDTRSSLVWDVHHYCDLKVAPWWPFGEDVDIEKRTWFLLEVTAQLTAIDSLEMQSEVDEMYTLLRRHFRNTLEGDDLPLISSVVKALGQDLQFCETQRCLMTSSGVPLNLNWLPGRMHTPVCRSLSND
ncbi:tetratricopeptide repeat protein [Vibrio splendidus]